MPLGLRVAVSSCTMWSVMRHACALWLVLFTSAIPQRTWASACRGECITSHDASALSTQRWQTALHNAQPPLGWCKSHIYHPPTASVAVDMLRRREAQRTRVQGLSSTGGVPFRAHGIPPAVRTSLQRTVWSHTCMKRKLQGSSSKKKLRWWWQMELCDIQARVASLGGFDGPGTSAVDTTAACLRKALQAGAHDMLRVSKIWDYVGPFPIGKGG